MLWVMKHQPLGLLTFRGRECQQKHEPAAVRGSSFLDLRGASLPFVFITRQFESSPRPPSYFIIQHHLQTVREKKWKFSVLRFQAYGGGWAHSVQCRGRELELLTCSCPEESTGCQANLFTTRPRLPFWCNGVTLGAYEFRLLINSFKTSVLRSSCVLGAPPLVGDRETRVLSPGSGWGQWVSSSRKMTYAFIVFAFAFCQTEIVHLP